ncbi:MAG TPA: ComF family protein [Acetobacteraceae bacterium]|jgi:ComF family protein|nr:ComF family protein [Acetobacteraceae bacterium]
MCSTVPDVLRRAGRSALDLLLPPQCLCCDARVEAQGLLCARCFGGTAFITEPCCVRCGVPLAAAAQALRGGLCPSCHAAPPVFGAARAALRYDAQARRLVLPLKHADRPELAAVLAPHLVRAGAALLRHADLLVPVPLHRRRLFQRRYNQAALLAAATSRITGVTAALDLLVRHRATVSLGDKSAAERAEVVRDAFAIRQDRQALLGGRSVVLIDDVMTSGATANACAAVLLAGGARLVNVLVAARVPDPRLG